jgi:RNA polymerase sigma factor (sigma-70 family)
MGEFPNSECSEALVRRLGGLVRQLARRLARRTAGATIITEDDLVSVGFAAMLVQAARYDGRSDLWRWCLPRVHGAMIDELRRTSWVPRSAYGSEPPRFLSLAAARHVAETDTASREAFDDMVHGVPRRERQVLEAIYVEGVESREVAARIGKHRSRVSQLHRDGLAFVRERLAATA